jgi:trigger factor
MPHIEVSEKEYCKLTINYEADPEQIEAKRNEVLAQFKKMPVSGFRPGKADMNAIQMKYRSQINDAIKRSLAEEAYLDVLSEKDLKPFGNPNFTSLLLLSNSFKCEFDLNVKPSFELAPYKDLSIPKQTIEHTITSLSERIMQEVRTKNGSIVPFTENDFVQIGDKIIVDYTAFDGENKLDNLSAEGELLTIGQSPLKDFDDNLLGMKVNENRQFTVHTTKDALPSIADKDITFHVKLLMGSKINPAPLDDILAKKLGLETFIQLQQAVVDMATARCSEMQRAAQIKQIAARLIDDNAGIRVPNWLSLSEAQYLVAKANMKWDEVSDTDKETYLQISETNVKLALILDRIREIEPEAQLSDQEALDIIRQNLNQNQGEKTPNEVIDEMNKSGYLTILVARLRDEYTLDFVLKKSTIIE